MYVYEGSVRVADGAKESVVKTGELAVLSEGTEVRLAGDSKDTNRAILVAGRSLREPVARHGPS